MENIWGRLKEPQKLSLYTGSSSEDEPTDLTKASIRKKVWEFMERNDIANFPRPVYHRIPNFKGASAAGDKVTTLPEFQEAKHIKVNPDKPQEEVRFRTLESGKTLFVPTPRLTQGLFNRLEPEPGCTKESLRKMSSRYGIDSLSKPVPMASRLKIDLVVIGSVAVDRLGHRIGKGEGFADLEWSMAASHHSAVTQDTVVISTVHDVQVFDELPESMFASHDLPVDIIVTPTEVIRVSDRLPKPDHIQWDIIAREKFEQVGILKELQFREKKAGKCVKLADGYEDVGPPKDPNFSVTDSNGQENGLSHGSEDSGKFRKKPEGKYPKRNNQRRGGERRVMNNQRNTNHNEEETNGDAMAVDKPDTKKQEGLRNKRSQNHRNHESIGIFVGRIPRTARVKELKDAIQERGLRTNNLVWKGVKGFAFLYFDKSHTKLTEEEICLQLKDLKLGETVLNIEPDKRKDKNKVDVDNETCKGTQENDSVTNNADKNESINHEKNRRRDMNKSRPNKKGTNSSDPAYDTNNEVLSPNQDAALLNEDDTKRTPVNGLHIVNNGVEDTKVKTDSELTNNSGEKSNISISTENGFTKVDINTSELESKVNKMEINDKPRCGVNQPKDDIKSDNNSSQKIKDPSNNKNTIVVIEGAKEAITKESESDNGKTQMISKDTKTTETVNVPKGQSQKEKKQEKDLQQKDQTPSKNKATNSTIIADSQISSQTISKEVNSNKKENQVVPSTTDSKDKLDAKTTKTAAKELKPADDGDKISKPTSDTKSTNIKTESISQTQPENLKEKSKVDNNEQKLKSQKKSSEDGLKDNSTSSANKQKTVELPAKKEEAKLTTSKSEASITKKEKSKTPDKEVKKEESSGGGFFKRFWK